MGRGVDSCQPGLVNARFDHYRVHIYEEANFQLRLEDQRWLVPERFTLLSKNASNTSGD